MPLQAWPDTAGWYLPGKGHAPFWVHSLGSLLIQLAFHCTHMLGSVTGSGSSACAVGGEAEKAETDDCLWMPVAYSGGSEHGCLGMVHVPCWGALSSHQSSLSSMSGCSSSPWHSSLSGSLSMESLPAPQIGFPELNPLLSTTFLIVRFWFLPLGITGTSSS